MEHAATGAGNRAQRFRLGCLHPFLCYRSPGDKACHRSGQQQNRRRGRRPGGSSCFDCLGSELSPHAASEQFEQHDDAILIAKLDQLTYHVLERACGHPYKLT